jgi:hypothetical protein
MSVLLVKHQIQSYRFCIGFTIYEIELFRVKAPSDVLRDTFLVEPIGRVKEMIPYYVQGTCPDGGTPVVKNISGLELCCNP